jgi:hypothetical protein
MGSSLNQVLLSVMHKQYIPFRLVPGLRVLYPVTVQVTESSVTSGGLKTNLCVHTNI